MINGDLNGLPGRGIILAMETNVPGNRQGSKLLVANGSKDMLPDSLEEDFGITNLGIVWGEGRTLTCRIEREAKWNVLAICCNEKQRHFDRLIQQHVAFFARSRRVRRWRRLSQSFEFV